ncbi:hypothetical protein B0H19DRAFT_65968 [Mycena capillaripes]|nr:hypothetical protein B0H19DRAFT_65968 [Mycena capillaripes]
MLIHALTTLENCLTVVGRNNEALAAAQEAAAIYTQNAPHMWKEGFIYTIRRQELGANAFHSLSLRLATSGDLDQALINAKKATELYRELVGLVPRHLPTLASSLRNLASTLWKVGRQDEAVTACKGAVDILRKVVEPETYFLPALAEALDQLSGYLTEKGDREGASAVTAESTEVRDKFASLPPQPDFLFEKVVKDAESDDDQEVVSEAACAIMSEAPDVSTPGQIPATPFTDTQLQSSGITAAAGDAVSNAAPIQPVSDALVFPVDATAISSVTAGDEGPTTMEKAISTKSPSRRSSARRSRCGCAVRQWIFCGGCC